MTPEPNNIVQLPPDSGIQAAGKIAELLRQALTDHDAVGIETSSVNNADLTTVQLLLAARKQASACGKSLALVAPPIGALHELLIALGCMQETQDTAFLTDEFWSPVAMQTEDFAA